jgi:hypothetical protein
MSGLSTFTYARKYFVSDEIEFVTEPDPEYGITYKIPEELLNLLSDNLIVNDVAVVGNKVGIGTTDIAAPRQALDVLGIAIVSDKVGIGNVNPQKELDVTGTAIVSNRVGIGSTEPQQRLDVAGSVKIDQYIYDSVNSPGKNGYYLAMDERGIRWIPIMVEYPLADPTGIGITDGMFILDEGVPLYP